ncbi:MULTISPECIES: divalent-cation tolerance protein CutA [unclassified Idiomarina]|uniref:divalent-cation tolerance protein CutA n=1 Tax=unclassified Idiomarina TaxID=2614829 RepID=UPI000B2ADA93|nr:MULTISPECIES: divalent-cation tolerance protein CutA [unclassified Idiomarina]MCH2456288.1 divalent-cation tolerance protein CutA [Idiomarina sp.]MCJ8317731.1 divalent-cation tolerance protein CutA [Idiomarina sp.]NQZ17290.1 divalent-cation tolerance protein CutA [Idiomarina sp.]|tara:strand:+ start:7650 stop:7961 length:312 start_codon:yes stop_codon:yes gene_type:complete
MVKLFYCTTDSQSSANELAASIVEQQLAACVNIIPGITSVYHWNNEIQHDQEWLLLIKTTDDMSEALKEAIMKIHPYDSPELISVDVTDGLPDYLQWVQDTVK